MSDSSWQHAVLRDIGVSRRGLRRLDRAPLGLGGASWGAEAPPRPAPEQAQPAAPAAQPVPPAPQPAPSAQGAAGPVPEAPPFAAPAMQSSAGSGEPAPLLPDPQHQNPQPPSEPRPEARAPQPETAPQWYERPSQQDVSATDQQATAQREAPRPENVQQPAAWPVNPQTPETAQPAEGAQPAESAPAPESTQPPQPAPAPENAQPPQPAPVPETAQAPEAAPEPVEPLVHSDFDWESAVNPVLGGVSSSSGEGAAPAPQAPAPAAQPAPADQASGVGHQIPAHELVRRNQHGDPLARRVGRGVRNAMGGGGREAREHAGFIDLMQRPVPSTRRIAVASVRGGAGKTTMAALVATELARYRQDRVLAADADAELGSLPLRLGVRTELSLFDLAGQNPSTFEEAARYLARTPEGLFVLSSTRGGRIAGEFTLDMFQSALSVVGRYVGTTVVDCGAGILTELNRGVVASAHGLVLVTPGTVDGALSARGALEWYAANDLQDLLRRTVIAMVSHAPQVGADLHRAQQMLSAWGLPVVFVPYDRHLATGSSVDMSKVSAAARTAVTRVVHEVFARALTPSAAR
ncbi:hypothetical protein AB0K34_05435 [Actinomadura sp. NPDC049382]|uniref:MinD/ParA family ATP-binding protein n=1 Tax=Actinomadura sp. NPDC049382 TaxID=3158220 RepID=UPI0034386F89